MLWVDGLCVHHGGRPVLRDVSIEVTPGEVTALLGPNGAGKSTLVLAVAGTIRPTAGSVVLGDRDLTGHRPEQIRQTGLAVVPEGRRLLPELSVADNLPGRHLHARAASKPSTAPTTPSSCSPS